MVCVLSEGSQRKAEVTVGPGLSHQSCPKIFSQSRACEVLGLVLLRRQFPYSTSDVGFLRPGTVSLPSFLSPEPEHGLLSEQAQ